LGKLLKRIRVDNGSEFATTLIETFCWKNGVIMETTVPYTPEQNGIAECAIAVFFQMVRCMLHSAKMDLRYWGEAFLYAVHIRSYTITSAIEVVPFEAWYERKPDISHL
jgi:transposase InsO family protein